MYWQEFTLPPYSATLFVVVGKVTGQELFDFVKKRYEVEIPKLKKEAADTGNRGCCNAKGYLVVVWLYSRDPATIAHEALHAVVCVAKSAGFYPISHSNEEAWAYLIDSIVGKITTWRD